MSTTAGTLDHRPPPIKKPVELTLGEPLAWGRYNEIYRDPSDKDRLIKKPKEICDLSDPIRFKRIADEVSPELKVEVSLDETYSTMKKICEFSYANDFGVVIALLDAFSRTQRVVVDAFVEGNVLVRGEGDLIIVDLDQAVRPDSPASKNFLKSFPVEEFEEAYESESYICSFLLITSFYRHYLSRDVNDHGFHWKGALNNVIIDFLTEIKPEDDNGRAFLNQCFSYIQPYYLGDVQREQIKWLLLPLSGSMNVFSSRRLKNSLGHRFALDQSKTLSLKDLNTLIDPSLTEETLKDRWEAAKLEKDLYQCLLIQKYRPREFLFGSEEEVKAMYADVLIALMSARSAEEIALKRCKLPYVLEGVKVEGRPAFSLYPALKEFALGKDGEPYREQTFEEKVLHYTKLEGEERSELNAFLSRRASEYEDGRASAASGASSASYLG